MVRVGLVGESPYDTTSISRLLKKRYQSVHFKALVEGIEGHNLDSPKLNRALAVALKNASYDVVIYMRDLDGFPSQSDKAEKLRQWYQKLCQQFGSNSLFLLNIWELEALILADIETFNKSFKTTHKFKGDPAMEKEPKETLMNLTRNSTKKFKVSLCPEIFGQLDIDTVEKNCTYFKEFLEDFEHMI